MFSLIPRHYHYTDFDSLGHASSMMNYWVYGFARVKLFQLVYVQVSIKQSSNTELSGIPPDLGEKEIFNLGESPRSGGINIFQPLIWHENFNDTKECLLWKIFFLHVECIDIRVFKNVGLIREKIEKNTKMQTHFPPDLGEFLKSRGFFWN